MVASDSPMAATSARLWPAADSRPTECAMAPATTSPATIAACRNSTSTMRRSVSTAYKGRARACQSGSGQRKGKDQARSAGQNGKGKGEGSVTPDEVDDDLGQLGAAVLLEEVPPPAMVVWGWPLAPGT